MPQAVESFEYSLQLACRWEEQVSRTGRASWAMGIYRCRESLESNRNVWRLCPYRGLSQCVPLHVSQSLTQQLTGSIPLFLQKVEPLYVDCVFTQSDPIKTFHATELSCKFVWLSLQVPEADDLIWSDQSDWWVTKPWNEMLETLCLSDLTLIRIAIKYVTRGDYTNVFNRLGTTNSNSSEMWRRVYSQL